MPKKYPGTNFVKRLGNCVLRNAKNCFCFICNKPVATLLIGACIPIITTYMINRHGLEVQNRTFKYELFKTFKNNYIFLDTCAYRIGITAFELLNEHSIDPTSSKTMHKNQTYKETISTCYAQIITVKLQLDVLHADTSPLNCMKINLEKLSEKINSARTITRRIYDPIATLGRELLVEFPKKWSNCMDGLDIAVEKIAINP